jgi:hypothetical protein
MEQKVSVQIVVINFDECGKLIHVELASSEKYRTMCSWFLGHRGENAGIMKETMNSIVDQVKAGRIDFGSDDEVRLRARLPQLISHGTCPTHGFCRTLSLQPSQIRWISEIALLICKLASPSWENNFLSTLCRFSPHVTPRT